MPRRSPRLSRWGVTPRESIESACRERGTSAVAHCCIDLLAGKPADSALLQTLGGPKASLDGPPEQRYWVRVWAARGLLWAWDTSATGTIVTALVDEHWRVREMAAKVIARHLVDEALDGLVSARDDPNPRVRRAVERALQHLTEQGA